MEAENFNKTAIMAAVKYIHNVTNNREPVVGIICGTGLGKMASIVKDPITIPFSNIPGFPRSTVKGHAGNLIIGLLAEKPVFLMQGRIHAFEGYSMFECTFPIRIMAELGVKIAILTNAAGSLRDDFPAGTIMNINDHINFVGMSGNSPLRGLDTNVFGERFVPMNNAYDKSLRSIVMNSAAKLKIDVKTGVYAMVGGPHFETAAECRMLKLLGADTVGMSTVHETIVARQNGIKVIGFTVVTNSCFLDSDDDSTSTETIHEQVLQAGDIIADNMCVLVEALIRDIPV